LCNPSDTTHFIILEQLYMARTKATLGEGVRLTDHLSASLLARIYPMDTVSALLDKHGCNSRRVRSFPASTAVYFSMGLSLYPEA
jgi:hypothetical protein